MQGLLEYVPQEFHKQFTAIIERIDTFCESNLNEDYHQLARDMAIKICQKGSPVAKGRPASWAAGIIHALGFVNFLHDRNTEPYMSSTELAKALGVSKGTMTAKSRAIRDFLDIMPMDPDWCLPDLVDDNPLIWMLEVNGLVIDIRNTPRDVQKAAYDNGLIPYIPADQKYTEEESKQQPDIVKFPCSQKKQTKQPQSKNEDNHPTLF